MRTPRRATRTQSQPAPSEPPPAPQAGDLCVACGLCCNGSLHTEANLAPQEIFFAESLGLKVENYPTHAAFRLPCPRWHNGLCSVYPVRPNVCGTYRCKLLRALDAGEVTFATALAHVTTAQNLIIEIDALLATSTTPAPTPMTTPATTSDPTSIWERVTHFAERHGHDVESAHFEVAFAALKHKTEVLHWHLKHYFHREKPNPKRTK